MKHYKVFVTPEGKCEAVKQGWSWPAFFLSFLWAFVKRMWLLGIGVVAAALVLGFALSAPEYESDMVTWINIASLIANIIFGFYGNVWRQSNLSARGYMYKTTVAAASPGQAVAMYNSVNDS